MSQLSNPALGTQPLFKFISGSIKGTDQIKQAVQIAKIAAIEKATTEALGTHVPSLPFLTGTLQRSFVEAMKIEISLIPIAAIMLISLDRMMTILTSLVPYAKFQNLGLRTFANHLLLSLQRNIRIELIAAGLEAT